MDRKKIQGNNLEKNTRNLGNKIMSMSYDDLIGERSKFFKNIKLLNSSAYNFNLEGDITLSDFISNLDLFINDASKMTLEKGRKWTASEFKDNISARTFDFSQNSLALLLGVKKFIELAGNENMDLKLPEYIKLIENRLKKLVLES